MLTKTDIGEIEFQIGYYTQHYCKTYMRNDSEIDIVLSKCEHMFHSLEYVLKLKINDGAIKFEFLQAINGDKTETPMMELTFAIDHALTILNKLKEW